MSGERGEAAPTTDITAPLLPTSMASSSQVDEASSSSVNASGENQRNASAQEERNRDFQNVRRGSDCQSAAQNGMLMIQEPDGTYSIAVDPFVRKPFVALPPEDSPAPAPPTLNPSILSAASPHVLLSDSSTFLPLETLIYVRRKRSFLFLLALEFCYFVLLFFGNVTLDRSSKSLILSSVFVINLAVDIAGFVGAYQNNVHCMSFFIVFEGLSIGIGAFDELSLMIICRLLILVLAMQVREGMLRLYGYPEQEELFTPWRTNDSDIGSPV